MKIGIQFIVIVLAVMLVLLALLLVWYFEGKKLSERTFVCGRCGRTFSPKWWKAGFSAHMGEHTVLKCPYCGEKGLCPPTYRET